jgi:hypothetical protein
MLGVTVPHEMTCFVLFLLRAFTPPPAKNKWRVARWDVQLRRVEVFPTVNLLHTALIHCVDDFRKFFTVENQFPMCY